jgi:hypothetical protein
MRSLQREEVRSLCNKTTAVLPRFQGLSYSARLEHMMVGAIGHPLLSLVRAPSATKRLPPTDGSKTHACGQHRVLRSVPQGLHTDINTGRARYVVPYVRK